DTVKPGDVIAEIETDKATMEVEAADEGVLGKILVAAGTEGVKVNTPIALLLGEGEDKGELAGALEKANAASAPAPTSSGNGAGAPAASDRTAGEPAIQARPPAPQPAPTAPKPAATPAPAENEYAGPS